MSKICQDCGIEQNDEYFSTGRLSCKFCVWYKNKGYKSPNGWTEDDVMFIMRNLYYQEITCLNDFVPIVHRDLQDIMKLIHDDFGINNMGSKTISVRCSCAECGKDTETFVRKALRQENIFCSRKCYAMFRSKYYIGAKASVYTKKPVDCDWCGAEILIPKNKQESVNKFGESHHFCSHDCYAKYRSKYYVGEKLYNTGKKMSAEYCNKVRQNTLKMYANGGIDRQTKPQRIVNDILSQIHIEYVNEYIVKYYALDNYLPYYNLAIEVMGDYFHSNPNMYDKTMLNAIQRKDVVRDKRKRTYLAKYYNLPILYLWENDILNFPEKCKNLILLYVQNNGQLQDYQSYNYNEDMSLKTKIINPYFIENP